MLGKVASFSMGGAKAEFHSDQFYNPVSLDKLLERETISADGSSMLAIQSLTQAEREVKQHIETSLKEIPPAQKVDVLTTSLARERLQKHFALAYANIFGSQIEALDMLNQRTGGIALSEARALFSKLQEKFPEFKDWTLQRYLSYLQNYVLINVSEDSVAITPIGRDFNGWLAATRLAKNRPL